MVVFGWRKNGENNGWPLRAFLRHHTDSSNYGELVCARTHKQSRNERTMRNVTRPKVLRKANKWLHFSNGIASRTAQLSGRRRRKISTSQLGRPRRKPRDYDYGAATAAASDDDDDDDEA